MKDQKSLDSSAQIRQFANSVQGQIDDLLANGVMASSIIVGSVFFAGYQLLGMEQLTVGSGAHFIDHRRLQVDENSSWYMFAGTSFAEERVVWIIATADRLLRWHLQ